MLCPETHSKLKIGLAFVGHIEEESMTALITAIHYPNKHWAHTQCWAQIWGCWFQVLSSSDIYLMHSDKKSLLVSVVKSARSAEKK